MTDAKAAPAAPAPQSPANTVTFTINDREVTVPKGTTVMAAAQQNGITIPHFCWHEGLSVAGVCRFCMVKVDNRPKLEIACNLTATPGMKVVTAAPEVKEAHKWALEFHLVNHPLDCPICDQAGECKLQDYYMEVGKYHSQMERPKVLKPKTLKVGDDLVLDTERCILCSRCVRFEDEVTKTGALGIFNRGDRAVIGTYPDKKIHHNYQDNLVDICPVGAFTSDDFRFKQRVWFLKEKSAICPGCSTGCHVQVHGKPEMRSYFRVKPEKSPVNGHWMCDVGRKTYKHMNQDQRLRSAVVTMADGSQKPVETPAALASLAGVLAGADAKDVALLVTPQYTCEEYEALFALFVDRLGVRQVLPWREPTEDVTAFDGILYRGDHNANTRGLHDAMQRRGLVPAGRAANYNGFNELAATGAKIVIALAPELGFQFPSLSQQLSRLAELPYVSLWTISGAATQHRGIKHFLPMKGFAEKRGTFINHAGGTGTLASPFPSACEAARDVAEVTEALVAVMEHL